MTFNFADTLSAAEKGTIGFLITIEGCPYAFTSTSATLGGTIVAGLTQYHGIVGTPEFETRKLDEKKRRQTGGGIRWELVEDPALLLRALFAVRTRRKTFITLDATDAATTITVDSTSAFPSAGAFWVGSEAITYSGKTATTFTGCTRGAYGSTAAALKGTTTDGQGVYDVVPSWRGRRCKVWMYLLREGETAPSSELQYRQIGTYVVDSSPVARGTGVWSLSATDGIDFYLSKALYTNIGKQRPSCWIHRVYGISMSPNGHPLGNLGNSIVHLTAAEVKQLKSNVASGGIGTLPIHLLIEGKFRTVEDGDANTDWILSRITEIGTRDNLAASAVPDARYTDTVWLRDDGLSYNHNTGADRLAAEVKSIRLAPIVRGVASDVLLWLLCSRYGGGVTTHDRLPGFQRETFDGFEWRLGGNIDEATIDTAAFASVGGSTSWWWWLRNETTAEDVLFEFCQKTDSFIFTKNTGELGCRLMADSIVSGNELDLTDSVIVGEIDATVNEMDVYPRVVLEGHFNDVDAKQSAARIEVFDLSLQERYPRNEEALTLTSKSTRVPYARNKRPENELRGVPFDSVADLERRLRRLQVSASGRVGLRFAVRCNLKAVILNIGSIVRLTTTGAENFENGTASNIYCRVVGIEYAFEQGEVVLELRATDSSKVIAPAAIVASAVGTTLTLATSTPECGLVDITKPGRMFAIGNFVRVFDISGVVSEQKTVIGNTDTTITIDTALSFAIQNNIDFVATEGAEVNDTTLTDHNYLPATDFGYLLENNESWPLTNVDAPRWR